MNKPRRNNDGRNDYFFSHFAMTKRQRSGFFYLIGLIVISELIIQFYPFDQLISKTSLTIAPTEEAMLLMNSSTEKADDKNEVVVTLKNFNPNALDNIGFEKLGFSKKQANSLIKYRYSLGGNFANVQEFEDAYVISPKMFETLKPFIQLKPFVANLYQEEQKTQGFKKNARAPYKSNLKPFDPNKLSAKGWMNLGFTERQVPVILNYKNSLANKRFDNLEQIRSCYVINDYMFNKIQKYIRISEGKTTIPRASSSSTDMFYKFNPNKISVSDWQHLGWSEEEAKNIIKYRDFVGGFTSIEDLARCKYISEGALEKMKKSIVFD